MFYILPHDFYFQERVICSIKAAIKYNIPANLLLAVAEEENGKPGERVENKNGTQDVGAMQFNTSYLKDLQKYGITPEDVNKPNCYPFELAAWRLHGHLVHNTGDIWKRAANYHSYTPEYNEIYREAIIQKSEKWQRWLKVRFRTYQVNLPNHFPGSQPKTFYKLSIKKLKSEKLNYNYAAAKALAMTFTPNIYQKGESDDERTSEAFYRGALS